MKHDRLSYLFVVLLLSAACDSTSSTEADSIVPDAGDLLADDVAEPDVTPNMDMQPVDDAQPETCADFCMLVQETCTDQDAQFESMETCQAACVLWPQGVAGQIGGNSLECRASHLEEIAAGEEPTAHCIHSGPSGGGECGTLCDWYCISLAENCAGEQALFASESECRLACEALSDVGEEGDQAGDTVQCRITFVEAAKVDPATNCALASPASGVCK